MDLVNLTIDGTSYVVDSLHGREAVGEHFRILGEVNGAADVVAADLLGKAFQIDLPELTIAGIVLEATVDYKGNSTRINVVLGPAHEILATGVNSRVFLALTAKDIIDKVIAEPGLDAAKWTVTTPPTRDHTAQYRESDAAFIDRLAREEGIYWYYDHDGGTKLCFADDATQAPAASVELEHRVGQGLNLTTPSVSNLASRTVATTEKFSTRDYAPKKPKLAIEGAKTAGKAKRERYEWPAIAATGAEATTRAGRALDSLRARSIVVSGRSHHPAVRCGKIITIVNPVKLPDAFTKLFCISIEWMISKGQAFEINFEAVPSTTAFRLPLAPRAMPPLGVETRWVRGASGQEIDADDSGDVFVQPPWDRNPKIDDSVTIRARAGQMQLAHSMANPRIGWSTLVGHRDGDLDRPWVMARLVDGTHPLPYAQPGNKTQTAWQTLTSPSDGTLTEIVYEDKKDTEKISIHTAKDMNIEVGDNEARTVGNDHTLEVDKDRTETVDADDKLTVKIDQSTTVKGSETTTVDGSRSITVKGNEEDAVNGKRAETVKKARTTDVGKNRKLTVGAAMSASAKKGFTREVLKKLTAVAGASWTTQADLGLVMTTKGDAEETIGGARMQTGKAGMQATVKGDYKDTVAAAHVVTAKGSVGESAKGKATVTIGAAMLAVAPEIEIVGQSEITILVGGSTISIKSSEVAVSAPAMAIAGPMLALSGSQAKHNP